MSVLGQHYGGQLVHRSRDELGGMEVIDDGATRSLHFGTLAKQSCMLLADPIALQLSYTRAMAAALLFHPRPQRILLVGLGGGSLAKFLHYHYPESHIDAVELREQVVKLAHGYFALPEADSRLHVVIDDAARFIRQADRQRYGNYDLIFIDAFVAEGIARSVVGMSFFDACRARLSPQGALTMNLWSGDFIHSSELLEQIGDSFDGQVLRLPVSGKENVIAITAQGQGEKPRRRLKQLAELARELEQRHGVEYTALLNTLKRHNRWPFA